MTTGNIKLAGIKHFVREQLGCACPEEVFSTIRVTHKPDLFDDMPVDYLVEIGNRLLVAVSINNTSKISAVLGLVFQNGKTYRDTHGFNRFRLVVATTDGNTQVSIQSAYDSLAIKDNKIHLHIIEPAVLPEEIAS